MSPMGGVICKLQELDRLVIGSLVYIPGEEQSGEKTALQGTSADDQAVRRVLPQPHMLPLVRQEGYDPPVGGVRYTHPGALNL